MNRIPTAFRRASEDTDDSLHRLRCLHVAISTLLDAPGVVDSPSAEFEAVCSLVREADEKLLEIDRLRAFEWVAVGGRSDLLTADEIAQARGE